MQSRLGSFIRRRGGLKQRNADTAVPDIVAVLFRRHDGNRCVRLGQSAVAVTWNLKHGAVRIPIPVRRTLDPPVLDSTPHGRRIDARWKGRLEKTVALLPVNPGAKVDPAGVCVEDGILQGFGSLAKPHPPPEHHGDRSVGQELHRLHPRFVTEGKLIVDIDVPGVPANGHVPGRHQCVQSAGAPFPAVFAIHQRDDSSCIIEGDAVEGGA